MSHSGAAVLFTFLALPPCLTAKEKPRPKILEILQVRIYTTNERAARDFYYGILRALAFSRTTETECLWCEAISKQTNGPVSLVPISGDPPANLMVGVLLRTDNAGALRKYLEANKVKVGKLTEWTDGGTFSVDDPEGHHLVFIQTAVSDAPIPGMPGAYEAPSRRWPKITHVGFIVRDRPAMDHFYKDVLNFRVSWRGGMKDGETNWVDMQLPDGNDWIEYVLNVPSNADQHTRGIMNHFAVGVADTKAADRELQDANLRLSIDEQPKIGREGKWQLNLYDPDGTRIEIMEFTPIEKLCCFDYSGPHPKP